MKQNSSNSLTFTPDGMKISQNQKCLLFLFLRHGHEGCGGADVDDIPVKNIVCPQIGRSPVLA
jgi:hypothetical protein